VTAPPPKSAFYNDLTDSEISDRHYRHAQDVWTRRKMTTFKEYHDFYVTKDVLLLTDCFQASRQAMLRAHGLDCLHFPSLPSLSFQMALKITQVELDLITDPDMFLMIESGSGRAQLRESEVRRNQPPHTAKLPTGRTNFLPVLSGRELSVRHVSVIQSSGRRFQISDAIRNRCVRREFGERSVGSGIHS